MRARNSATNTISAILGSMKSLSKRFCRLILRRPPQGHEATYRILLDQIPPPAEPGPARLYTRLLRQLYELRKITMVEPSAQTHKHRKEKPTHGRAKS